MGDRTRWGLTFIIASFCILGGIHSVVVPLFEAPDEIWHFSFVRVLATQHALPEQPSEGKDMWLREAGQLPLYYFVAAPLVALLDTSDFPDFVRFNAAHPAITASSKSKTPNVFIHTPHEAFPYQGAVLAVHVVRLLTVLWGAGAIVGVYLVAREIVPGRPGLALASASIAAYNPHLIFISSVVNNDAAAICLGTFSLWLTIRLCKGEARLNFRGARHAHVPDRAALSRPNFRGARHALSRFNFRGARHAHVPDRAALSRFNFWGARHAHVPDKAALNRPNFRGARHAHVPDRAAPGLELALGLVLGLALLSKVSALALLPLVGLALCLRWWRERNGRALLKRGLSIFGLATLVSAWWYVRNWLLYGDPLAWRVWLIDIGVQPIGLAELLRQFGQVATSFWSPYDGLLPPVVFWALGLVMLLTVVGWARLLTQRSVFTEANAQGLLLAGTWFALLLVSLVRYMTITPAAAGRLLFPGIAAWALFLVLGLNALVPRQWSGRALGGVGAGLLVLSVATPFCAIRPRFVLSLVDAQDISPEIVFDEAVFGDVRLLGAEITPDEVQAGDEVKVTLYWEAQATPPDDLRAVVWLWTLGGRLVGQRDTTPAGELYPPDLWRAGDVVRDVYRLPVGEDGPAVCRVTVSVLDGDGSLGEVSSLTALKLTAAPVSRAEITHPLAYTLGDEIELAGYDVSIAEGLEVTLYWRSLAEMEEDYTVFVHLLDGEGTLLGQGDGPPLNSDYPTSYWSPGEMLADTHIVPFDKAHDESFDEVHDETLPAGAYLLVGLYRLADGVRLPVYDTLGERVLDDAIRLDAFE